MKISPQWLRDFVDLRVDPNQLADELTLAGIAVESVTGEGDAVVFEMEITTNRPDAMNHYGVARECSALYDLPLKPLSSDLPTAATAPAFPVHIEDIEGCARFTARVIHGVKVHDSPDAIAQRLLSVGQRPINNIADASNYTLWEMGQPTHAYDLDLLEGGKIIVRRARAGETLKTLDGVERKLSQDDLIIADAVKPVGLAGVMGGFDSMITQRTKNVLVEAAWFDPAAIRASSKRHGLHTDASHRFERGADYGATSVACARVTEKILASAGGQLQGAEISIVGRALDQAPVALRISEVRRILGEKLEVAEIVRVLKRLGFELLSEPSEDVEYTAIIPSWRLDVEREIDLIEEIARLHGYDKFANTLPAYVGAVVEEPDAFKDEKVRSTLLALGYNETVSLTFISHEDAKRFSSRPALELANPLSEEASVMRTSLVPGMLHMLSYNLNRAASDLRLFEAGNVFNPSGATAEQRKQVCFAAVGAASAARVDAKPREIDFFDVKGDVETLLHSFEYRKLEFQAPAAKYYHPGRSAQALLDGEVVAEFGQLHPEIAAERKLKAEIFLAEIYLDRLYAHELRQVRYEELPRYPAVERDFSFLFADEIQFADISRAVDKLTLKELQSFAPAEIFRGGSVPAGQYSLLLRARFQSNERTLRDDEVADWSTSIAKALTTLGGVQRA